MLRRTMVESWVIMAGVLIGLLSLGPVYAEHDLTGRDLAGVDLQGVDLSGANLAGVNLDGASGLSGADLSGVILSGASLRRVDLSHALLFGAQLNGSNLEGANLSGAILTNNPSAGIDEAANLTGAHLKNVNLSNADLSGANLTHASFYGSIPAGRGTCDTSWGFTRDCASAAGATLNHTHFTGAFLYGVDFSNTTIEGVHFAKAVLIATNFAGATLSLDSNRGTDVGFLAAYLQGAQLRSATLSGVSLLHAFVDFRRRGNSMFVRLPGTHTAFHGWKTPGQAVCVSVSYDHPTTVPRDNPTLTCPDGAAASGNTPAGCGRKRPRSRLSTRNRHWKSPVLIDHTTPPGSYRRNATFSKRAEIPICDAPDVNW